MIRSRDVATVRHFRHIIVSPIISLLMKNDKQRITYFNYVCFMFIVLMTNFHKLKDKHLKEENKIKRGFAPAW
jgi:GTP-binding protein EngB required for normal cell division